MVRESAKTRNDKNRSREYSQTRSTGFGSGE
jgi:hypothetical protein